MQLFFLFWKSSGKNSFFVPIFLPFPVLLLCSMGVYPAYSQVFLIDTLRAYVQPMIHWKPSINDIFTFRLQRRSRFTFKPLAIIFSLFALPTFGGKKLKNGKILQNFQDRWPSCCILSSVLWQAPRKIRGEKNLISASFGLTFDSVGTVSGK